MTRLIGRQLEADRAAHSANCWAGAGIDVDRAARDLETNAKGRIDAVLARNKRSGQRVRLQRQRRPSSSANFRVPGVPHHGAVSAWAIADARKKRPKRSEEEMKRK